jgi:hypothetical protein
MKWHGRGVTFLNVLMETNDSRGGRTTAIHRKAIYITVQSDASSASICATSELESPSVLVRKMLNTMEVKVHS